MASLSLLSPTLLRAEDANQEVAAQPLVGDMEFLLFLANSVEEDGEWITEMDLEEISLEELSAGEPEQADDQATEMLPAGESVQ